MDVFSSPLPTKYPIPDLWNKHSKEWNQPGLGSILLTFVILKNIGYLIDYLLAFIGKLF